MAPQHFAVPPNTAQVKLSCAAMVAQFDGTWYQDDVETDGAQLWQALEGLSVPVEYTVPSTKQPAWQVPPPQILPVPQFVPSVLLDHADALVFGLQTWHVFEGFVVPLATSAPSIQQPLWHEPALQTCPLPQLVPLVAVVQDVGAKLGWQVWQALVGLAVVFARNVPAMKQPALHAPALQNCAPLQNVPSSALDQAEVEAAGLQA